MIDHTHLIARKFWGFGFKTVRANTLGCRYSLKARGVQEVGFISMDEMSGLEEGARTIFPEVVVQRCIVHLIRNSLKYVPTRDYKDFTAHLKKICGAIAVCKRYFAYVEQLFDYPSTGSKIMYTTNAIEAVNSGFCKVTKRGAFPNDYSVFKLLYLKVIELQKKMGFSPRRQMVARKAINFS